jgi:amidase
LTERQSVEQGELVAASLPLPEYSDLDGLALGDLVRRRELRASELLDAAIARAERVNPALNAIVRRFDDIAHDLAGKAEACGGPFAGVPFLLKDIDGAMAGVATRMGSAFVPDAPAAADAHLVARMKQAGLVPFGKTNVSEYGLLPLAEARIYGPARNPWNPEHTPGGSSGGAAAAVAAGVVPLAHATDGGGSIRIPASCCGLVGLKPSRGRLSEAPAGDWMNGMTAQHVVTRTVRDSAAALDACVGAVPGDPYAAPPRERPFLDATSDSPRRLRIAFTADADWAGVHADCRDAVRHVARLCEALGHDVEEVPPPLSPDAVREPFLAVYAAGLAAAIDATALALRRAPTPECFEPSTWSFYERGRSIGAARYLISIAILQRVTRAFAQHFERFDLWLTPTLGTPPPRVGDPELVTDATHPAVQRFVLFNAVYNLSGQPAISLPLFWKAAGLPIGTTFGARFGGEDLLFRIAGQLEQAQPWNARRARIHA